MVAVARAAHRARLARQRAATAARGARAGKIDSGSAVDEPPHFLLRYSLFASLRTTATKFMRQAEVNSRPLGKIQRAGSGDNAHRS